MIKIKLNYGTIYCDDINNLDALQDSKFRLYDSNQKYLDYYEMDTLIELALDSGLIVEEYLKVLIEDYQKTQTIEELLDEFLCFNSYTCSKEWENLIEDLFNCTEEDISYSEVTKEMVERNDYVNKIGDYYILGPDFFE